MSISCLGNKFLDYPQLPGSKISFVCEVPLTTTVLVRKCFIKHMCFIFTVMLFFLLKIAKKCFIVLCFWKNVLKWVELPSGCVVPGS